VAGLDRAVAPGFVDHAGPVDPDSDVDALGASVLTLRTAYPEARLVPFDIVAAADRVVARVRVDGMARGRFLGVPLSGGRIWGSSDVFRVADHQIAERVDIGIRVGRPGMVDEPRRHGAVESRHPSGADHQIDRLVPPPDDVGVGGRVAVVPLPDGARGIECHPCLGEHRAGNEGEHDGARNEETTHGGSCGGRGADGGADRPDGEGAAITARLPHPAPILGHPDPRDIVDSAYSAGRSPVGGE
jgi:hypothetical protein